jgi:hypothetical protein
MNIRFTDQELNFIMQVLGDLPTKTGAYMLLTSIQTQINQQAQPPVETAKPEAPKE